MGKQLWSVDRSCGGDGGRLYGRVWGKVIVGENNEDGVGLIFKTSTVISGGLTDVAERPLVDCARFCEFALVLQ